MLCLVQVIADNRASDLVSHPARGEWIPCIGNREQMGELCERMSGSGSKASYQVVTLAEYVAFAETSRDWQTRQTLPRLLNLLA